MGVDVLFVEILVFVVGVYELFSSRSAREDEGTGEGRVRCEDCVVKERSREETPESFKVDDACDVVRGGEGGQVVDGEGATVLARDRSGQPFARLGLEPGLDVRMARGAGRVRTPEATALPARWSCPRRCRLRAG